jgi:hypothetical protein
MERAVVDRRQGWYGSIVFTDQDMSDKKQVFRK